ncbi:nucleotidyltransferase family protein [bacterium]|nr:nucleotidyltransferase family protein [candidate division CSSED10-310 bacterium]
MESKTAPFRISKLEYWALVPAAGRSRRMGRFKLLLPWPPETGTKTVIESTVRSLLDAGIGHVVIITGYRADEINRVLSRCPVDIVFNPDPDAPMSSSLQAAMDYVPPGVELILLPGDHPAVQPETIRDLMYRHDENPSAIHVPAYRRRRGHPAVFPAGARDGFLHPDPHRGVRALMADAFEVEEVSVDDPGVRINLDSPDDYADLFCTGPGKAVD